MWAFNSFERHLVFQRLLKFLHMINIVVTLQSIIKYNYIKCECAVESMILPKRLINNLIHPQNIKNIPLRFPPILSKSCFIHGRPQNSNFEKASCINFGLLITTALKMSNHLKINFALSAYFTFDYQNIL